MKYHIAKSGFAALPTILLISSILVEVVVVGVVLGNAVNNTRNSEKLASEAYSAAVSGAEDAMIRVIRYRDCPVSPYCPSSYSLSVGLRTADVTIESSSTVAITSTGTALSRQKKVRVILSVSSNTGEVSLQSFKEIPL